MTLKEECEDILRRLLSKHACLQPENNKFDRWDNQDAKEIVADLIELINQSDAIQTAHTLKDWGK